MVSGREFDDLLVKIIKTNNKVHFNAIFDEIKQKSPKTSRRTVSKHLSKLFNNGIIDRDPVSVGKKRFYQLSADSEIALLINKDFNLYDNKKFDRKKKEEQLKENVRLLLLRLAVISYIRYLDPKKIHEAGTIYLPHDKNGNIFYFPRYKKIRPVPIPDNLDHIPIESISEDQGVSAEDLRQPPKKMSEIGHLFSHISLSKEELNRCINILTTKAKPPLVSRIKYGVNRYHIVTDSYPVLKDYVRDWLTLLLQLISSMEYTWQNVRKETKGEIKWYDRIFGESHRTSILLSARDNRKILRNRRGRRQYRLMKQQEVQRIKNYDGQIKNKLRDLRKNEKYLEFENKHPLITKILKEAIYPKFMEGPVTSRGVLSG